MWQVIRWVNTPFLVNMRIGASGSFLGFAHANTRRSHFLLPRLLGNSSEFTNGINQGFEILQFRIFMQAVSQIKDMSRTALHGV